MKKDSWLAAKIVGSAVIVGLVWFALTGSLWQFVPIALLGAVTVVIVGALRND